MKMARLSAAAITAAFFAFAACGGESQRSRPTDGGATAGSHPSAGADGEATAGSHPSAGATGGATIGGASMGSAGAPSVGGNSAGSSGAAGQATGGRPSTGGAGGGADAGAATGGSAGEGEAGAPSCPRIECPSQCPTGRWVDANDCATCACAPPPTQLIHDNIPCPGDQLSLTAMSSYFIGGVDRWIIDFEWTCAEAAVGRPKRGKLQVRLAVPQEPPIDASNRTFYLGTTQNQYLVSSAMVGLAGSGVPEIQVALQPTSSFLSIRREGDDLVGGIYYAGEDASQGNDATLAGPFRVPVPTI